MPERPDLRTISGNIRDSLADCDRDTLLDILTFVFKEYLVEGPPPLLVHQAERVEDLESLSFAQIITALQTRLDVPELDLFQVDGDQVSVRVGGVMTPLSLSRGGAGATPPRAPAAQSPNPPRVQVIETDMVRRPPPRGARPSVDEAVSRGRGDLAGMAQDAVNQARQQEGSAPPPRGGLSIRGRTSGGSMMPDVPGAAPQAPSGTPTQAQPEAAQSDTDRSEPGDDDSASTRFSLLELD